MSDVNRDAPPTNSPAAAASRASRHPPIANQSTPRAGSAAIDIDNQGGVAIRINYRYRRPSTLVIGAGLLALLLTGKITYDAMTHGRAAVNPGWIAAAMVLAVVAVAAWVRGHGPPLHANANARELRVRGGPLKEDVNWRRDDVVAVTGEDLDQPNGRPPRKSIVIELRGDEYVTFPVATKQEQAAIVQALRGALKLASPTDAAASHV